MAKRRSSSIKAVDPVALLAEASATLLSNLQFSSVLARIVEVANQLIEANAYAVWLRTDRDTWKIVASRGLSERYISETTPAGTGEIPPDPIVVPDVRTSALVKDRQSLYRSEDIASFLAVPLRRSDQVEGTVTFYYREKRDFSSRDLQYAAAFANLAGAALRTAELYERQEQEQRRSTFLAEASTLLASSLDYEITLKRVAELAVPTIADWCSVHLYDNGKLERVAVAHSDPKKIALAQRFSEIYPEELRDDRGAGRMLKTGVSEIYPNITDEMLARSARSEEHLSMMRELGMVSYIGAPLIARGKPLGVVRLISAESGRRFSQQDLYLAEALAHRAAISVDNAGLHRSLQRSEAEFRQLANSIPQLAWMGNPDGWIFWYNDGWYRYTGTTPDEMVGWGWQRVHDPEVLPTVLEKWKASTQTGEMFEMIFPLRAANGKFRPFLTRVIPLKDERGAVVRWFGTGTDIGEIKRVQDALVQREAELRVSQERLRLTQTAAKLATWEYDIDRDVYTWSEEVLALFGRSDMGFTQQSFLSLMYYSADQDNVRQAFKTALTRNRDYETQFRIIRSDGQARWIAARGRPFFNQGRSLMLGVFFDITEAQQAAKATAATVAPKKKKSASGRRAS